MDERQKPLFWIASAKKDLKAMPEDVQDVFGFALHLAQVGKKHGQAKPLRGFGGAGVLEVIEDYKGDTYRAVYGQVGKFSLRFALFPEEIERWH